MAAKTMQGIMIEDGRTGGNGVQYEASKDRGAREHSMRE